MTRQSRNSRHCPEKELLKKKKNLSQLDNGTVTRKARNRRQCPEKETIKKKPRVNKTRELPQEKQETAGSAPKRRIKKKKPCVN